MFVYCLIDRSRLITHRVYYMLLSQIIATNSNFLIPISVQPDEKLIYIKFLVLLDKII